MISDTTPKPSCHHHDRICAAAAWRCRALCPAPSSCHHHHHDRICFCCFGITTTSSLWESIYCANLIDVDVTVFQELEYISKIGGGAAAWCVCPKPRLLQPGTLLNRWQHCLLSNDATWISHPITYPC